METVVTSIDWASLIYRGCESKELDYKSPGAWGKEKDACCELVKDILAMANTGGGWLVIGVRETGTSFVPEGVTEEQAASYETTDLNKFLNNYADPPINTRIHKPEVKGKRYIVIEVPGFSDTPHICQKDYPKVLSTHFLYVRTANNESAPLKSSADFRVLIERATRNRADQILSSVHAILRHGSKEELSNDREMFERQAAEAQRRCDELNPHISKRYGYRESIFYPASFNKERFNIADLKSSAKNASIDLRGWPFLYYSEDNREISAILDGCESVIKDPSPLDDTDEFHFWQFRQSGMMFIKQVLREDTHHLMRESNRLLYYDSFSIIAFEAVHCLIKLYEGRLNDDEKITLQFRLTEMDERILLSREFMLRGQFVSHIQLIEYSKTLSLAEWRAAQVEHGLKICEYVFQRMNWDNPYLHGSRSLINKAFNREL